MQLISRESTSMP